MPISFLIPYCSLQDICKKKSKKFAENLTVSIKNAMLLSKATLREGISLDMAIEYFIIFQEMFNCYFQCKSYENEDFHSFIKDHELNIAPVLDIMLYGITDKK